MAFTNLALTMYPVGSLYFSSLPESPAKCFGGTWTQLDDNKFLLPSNSFGQTGGSDTHTHAHKLQAAFNSNHASILWRYSRTASTWYANWYMRMPEDGYEPTSDTDQNYAADIIGSINNASNVPAYRTVYCWYRVS